MRQRPINIKILRPELFKVKTLLLPETVSRQAWRYLTRIKS